MITAQETQYMPEEFPKVMKNTSTGDLYWFYDATHGCAMIRPPGNGIAIHATSTSGFEDYDGIVTINQQKQAV